MNSIAFAPRPPRSNWRRVVYNVMHDVAMRSGYQKGWRTKHEIWDLVPKSMHVPHAKKKFDSSVNNMVFQGVLVATELRLQRGKKYRLASREEYDTRQRELARKAHKPAKKVAAKKPVAQKVITRGGATGSLLAQIDIKIAKLSEDLNKLRVARDAINGLDF